MGEGLRAFIKELRKSGGQAWRTCPFFCLKSEEGGSILPRGGVKQRKRGAYLGRGGVIQINTNTYKQKYTDIYRNIYKQLETASNQRLSGYIQIEIGINTWIYAEICRCRPIEIYIWTEIYWYISGLYWILKNRVYDVNKELRTPIFGKPNKKRLQTIIQLLNQAYLNKGFFTCKGTPIGI